MRTLSAFLPALLLVACDTSGNAPPAAVADAKTPAAAAKTDAPAAPRVDEARAGVSGDRKGLSDCLTECGSGNVSDTDRATCRLNCETSFRAPTGAGAEAGAGAGAAGGTPTAVAAGTDPVDKTVTCMSDCYTKGGEKAGTAPPDAKACVDSCKTTASGAANAPATGVLDTLGTCVGGCYADKTLSETNRATCELNCAQTARVAGPAPTADAAKKG